MADTPDDHQPEGGPTGMKRPQQGVNDLIYAIKEGQKETVENLLQTHKELLNAEFDYCLGGEKPQTESTTPLFLAIKLSRQKVMSILVDKGADPDLAVSEAKYVDFDDDLVQRLKVAIIRDDAKDLHEILATEANQSLLNGRFKYTVEDSEGQVMGMTPLMLAAALGKEEITEILLEKGADPYAFTISGGSTACSLAAYYHHRNIVKSILGKENVTKDILEVKNFLGATPLLIAAERGSVEIFEFLVRKEVELSVEDYRGNSWLHLAAGGRNEHVCSDKPGQGYLKMIDSNIRKDDFKLLERKNRDQETALILAATHDKADIINLLLAKGANIESADRWGYTPLLNAAAFNGNRAILVLLKDANITARSFFGQNVLHVACVEGSDEIVESILEQEPRHIIGLIRSKDLSNETPLQAAISSDNPSIVFKLLNSNYYMPVDPLQGETHFSLFDEQASVSDYLLKRGSDILNHITPVFYWALLNGNKDLIDVVMKQEKLPELQNRQGITWLHVIALSSATEVSTWDTEKLNLSDDILAMSSSGKTPLHFAAEKGNFRLVPYLLRLLLQLVGNNERKKEDNNEVFHLILGEGKRPTGLISLIVDKTNMGAFEEELWKILRRIVNHGSGFDNHSERAELVMGAAFWRFTTGEEKAFNDLRKQIEGEEANMQPLEFAIKHKYPLALWWLLSSGEYFGEIHIKKGEDFADNYYEKQADRAKGSREEVISNLLSNPPPLRRPTDGKLPPQFMYDEHSIAKDEHHGTVVDVAFTTKSGITMNVKRAPIADIIYQKGPKAIMSEVGISDPQQIFDIIYMERSKYAKKPFVPDNKNAQITPKELEQQRSSKLEQAEPSESKEADETTKKIEFRWIHLPTNNELMIRVSKERGESKEMPYICWAKEPDQIPDEGNPDAVFLSSSDPVSHEISHSCLTLDQYYYESLDYTNNRDRDQVLGRLFRQTAEKTSKDKTTQNITILKKKKKSINGKTKIQEDLARMKTISPVVTQSPVEESHFDRGGEAQHEISEADTAQLEVQQRPQNNQRNPLAEAQHETQHVKTPHPAVPPEPRGGQKTDGVIGTAKSSMPDKKSASQGEEMGETQILVVNQLWIWIIYDGTIITSVTKEVEDSDNTFLQRVLDNIYQADFETVDQGKSTRQTNDQGQSTQMLQNQILQVILDTAQGMFNARDIKVSANIKVSPLDAYRKAIQRMRDGEINLFSEFQSSLDHKKKDPSPPEPTEYFGDSRNSKKEDKEDKEDKPENPYENIYDETELLKEIKDILDELNILKTLALDQDHVNSLLKHTRLKGRSQTPAFSLGEFSSEIESMAQDAQNLQSDINTLLSLKQQKAGIVEAQATRRQSDTVMTFTVVTIIFLPASFLTSLFALDISDFPHENGSVAYKGWWIFPIIFGVSFLVSAFFVALAFNANLLKHNLPAYGPNFFHQSEETDIGKEVEDSKSMVNEVSPPLHATSSPEKPVLRVNKISWHRRGLTRPPDPEGQQVPGGSEIVEVERNAVG
ncbi:hypothetical protein N7466_005816 [Penicillium verhagenii]|uniref:uncharacterized protein n=1 Tax=Penicillium verhagenii TaxID=1562060 RepID=UPI002545529F|nr:uncharacterized protein N7466_005816 [Penicillium verhagenii]KAJ5930323.1 hypothetical protein N7466_005816 [Penicillium verhagenii]